MNLEANNLNSIEVTLVFFLLAIFILCFDRDFWFLSVFTVILGLGIFVGTYEIAYDICNRQIVLTEKISNSYVSTTANEDAETIKLKYVNKDGKETTLILPENAEIYHKKGKENKVVYKETKCHNLLGLRKKNTIDKVTIYKKVMK